MIYIGEFVLKTDTLPPEFPAAGIFMLKQVQDP